MKNVLNGPRIYIYILSKAKSADGGNHSILGFSFFNIHAIQNPKASPMKIHSKLKYRANNSMKKKNY